MKKNIITIAVAATMFSAACTTVQKSRTTKTTDIYGAGVMHVPVIADLKVSETKAIGTSTAINGELLENAKQVAIANAIESSNADVLVEPVFKSTTIGTRVTFTVTGFPANYKNFRNATAADSAIMKIGILQQTTPVVKQDLQQKKKGGGGAVLGVLLTVGLVILIIAMI